MRTMNKIYVYMKEAAVRVLGPGVRYVLWVQGCHKRCPGCIASNSHDMKEGTPIHGGALALEIALSDAQGLTISGGEPFLQADALADMIDEIHKIRPMGVIVYTGYTYEELLQNPSAERLLKRIDLLIDGEYIEEKNSGKGLYGSSNQRAIALTSLYEKEATVYAEMPRETEIFRHGREFHEVGIPKNKKKEGEQAR